MSAGAIGTQVLVAQQTRSDKIITRRLIVGDYDLMQIHLNLLNLLKNKNIITFDEGQAVLDKAKIELMKELQK